MTRCSLALLPLVAVAGLVGAVPCASACTCAPADFPTQYANSDAIFVGEVLEITSAAPEFPTAIWALLSVEAMWKGSPGPVVRVFTEAAGSACGYEFSVGTRHLVFAYLGDVNPGEFGPPPGEQGTNW